MTDDFRRWPKPDDYVEATYATPDQMRRWVGSMPDHLQEAYFTEVRQQLDRANACWERDHEGRLEDCAERHVTKDWHGLRRILAEVYPADIFTGASGDLGPRLVALLREIDAAEVSHA